MIALREFIREKVTFMANRPAFVASNKESYITQLLLLLEMYGGIRLTDAHLAMRKHRAIWYDDIDLSWAGEVGLAALKLLEKAAVTREPGWRND